LWGKEGSEMMIVDTIEKIGARNYSDFVAPYFVLMTGSNRSRCGRKEVWAHENVVSICRAVLKKGFG
jgi:hypothetical protein